MNSSSSGSPSTGLLSFSSGLGKDFLASVVVFLVALPLCMGIAIASGVPPAAGLITGIVGGLVVGSLSGCPLQVSGPAAGLAVAISELIEEHGMERLGVVIIIAGVVQLIAGFSRLAQWFRSVPPAVINGMLSGIGILIFASQFHVMVDDSPKGSGIQNLLSIPGAVWKGVTPSAETSHHLAAIVGLLTISALILWNRFRWGPFKLVPGSLIAILIATGYAWFHHYDIKYVDLPDNLLASLSFPDFAKVPSYASWELLFDGIAVAFIAAAETLLTATALDKMHRGERTNYDRELSAQGIGNIICGLIGGLPMTGVMVRSGVNVSAGAKSRASSVLHGVWLLLFVAFLPFIIELIPTASLAALLVYTGWKLANFAVAKEMLKFGRSELAIYVITVVAIVSIDLLEGVLIGIVLSVGKLLYIFSHLEIRVADAPERNRTDLFLRGAATFLSLPRFAQALESVRADTELHVHLEALDYVDHACLDMLKSWEDTHVAGGGHLIMDWGTLNATFRERRRGTGSPPSTGERRAGVAYRSSSGVRTQQLPASEETAGEDSDR